MEKERRREGRRDKRRKEREEKEKKEEGERKGGGRGVEGGRKERNSGEKGIVFTVLKLRRYGGGKMSCLHSYYCCSLY